jgi:RNA polymerase sigma-70 factor (ECF subfamily)
VEPYGPDVPDAELLGALGQDPLAFEQFYRRHFTTVARYLARRCKTPEDVADATSATFLAVMLWGPTYDPKMARPVSWLLAIAANEAKRLHRKDSRHGALLKRVRGSSFLGADDTERLAEMIDAAHDADGLKILITEVPQGEQDLLREMVANDATVTEAARAIGISPGAGRVRLSRLRGRVLQAVRPRAAGGFPAPGAGQAEGPW